MQIKSADQAQDYQSTVGNIRSGDRKTNTLLTGKEGAPNNYKMVFGGGGESGDWITPRHRHTFDQIRYPLTGDYVLAKDEVLQAGWVCYFPQSVYYGPQKVSGNVEMMTLQFGGPSGLGYWSMRQRKAGFDALVAKGGKFEAGVYTWFDEKGQKHNQDSAEALVEEVFKTKVVYPEGRYANYVKMNPAAFDWIKDRDQPGVATKRLGSFTERDVRVQLVRLDKGASFAIGREQAPEVMFMTQGTATAGGQSHGRHTAFGTEADDPVEMIVAEEACEFFYAKMPTF